jgi:hypothetical protein
VSPGGISDALRAFLPSGLSILSTRYVTLASVPSLITADKAIAVTAVEGCREINELLDHVRAGGRLGAFTRERCTIIDIGFEAAGAWLLKNEGKDYRLHLHRFPSAISKIT